MDLPTLQQQLHARGAELDFGGPLSAQAVRRLACDARLIPVLLGGASQPLDIGRVSYTVPAHIRRALAARDRGCAFVGCGRPVSWCDAHHLVHWTDGGDTSLANLCLLCAFHHRVVHHDGWTARMGPTGHPEFLPPRWIDPHQKPRAKPWRHELDKLSRGKADEKPD